MLIEFLKNLNWVDILLVCILVRIVFIGIKNGFVIEFFKIIGVVVSTFVTLHYYSFLSNIVIPHLKVFEPVSVVIIVFLVLWFFVTYAFKLIRDGVLVLFAIKPHAYIDRWVAALIAVFRGLLICSLTFFVILLSHDRYAVQLSQKSISKYAVRYLAPGFYTGIYYGFVIKFFPMEKINQDVIEVEKLLDHPVK